jgi:hypothetical protein
MCPRDNFLSSNTNLKVNKKKILKIMPLGGSVLVKLSVIRVGWPIKSWKSFIFIKGVWAFCRSFNVGFSYMFQNKGRNSKKYGYLFNRDKKGIYLW